MLSRRLRSIGYLAVPTGRTWSMSCLAKVSASSPRSIGRGCRTGTGHTVRVPHDALVIGSPRRISVRFNNVEFDVGSTAACRGQRDKGGGASDRRAMTRPSSSGRRRDAGLAFHDDIARMPSSARRPPTRSARDNEVRRRGLRLRERHQREPARGPGGSATTTSRRRLPSLAVRKSRQRPRAPRPGSSSCRSHIQYQFAGSCDAGYRIVGKADLELESDADSHFFRGI